MTDANVNRDAGTTSLSLIDRVRALDPAAWVRLVKLYDPLLDRWCARAGLQPADVADVKQEVFAMVSRAIDTFRRDRPGDSFRGWLYTITRNKLRDRAKKAAGETVGGEQLQQHLESLPAEDNDPEPADAEGERIVYLQAIDMIRAEFEPKTWEAFWRVTVDGRTPADVAEELGVTSNVVYLARSRILRRLREEFNGLLYADTVTGVPPKPELEEE